MAFSFTHLYIFVKLVIDFKAKISSQNLSPYIILCLDGFEPGPGPSKSGKIVLLVYIEIFRSEQMTHAIS